MSKVVIDDSKLVNIADAIRNKNGSANKYTPTEMATAIGDIKVSTGAELAPEDLVISGSCNYMFYEGNWNWFIEKFGDKITTKDITDGKYMFQNNKSLSSIPFSLNFKENYEAKINEIFSSSYFVSPPYINNLKVKSTYRIFCYSNKITEIPEDYFDTWDFSAFNEGKDSNYDASQMFLQCYSLRKIPSDLSMFYNKNSSTYNMFYSDAFYKCLCLEKATNLPVQPTIISSNVFDYTFRDCNRLKQITFSLNGGIPKTASWQAQVINLSQYVGYAQNNLTAYGIPSDTRIIDDESYQLLKNNEDAWTRNIAYSRYNHDSAVETINTLPDTSAYLAESGGTTNIIQFRGANGSATDGGAINTLTEAEIAVAAAKGWSVSFV